MKKILLILLCVPIVGISQQLDWARTFYGTGDIGDEIVRAIVSDKNGNVYIAGDFTNHLTLDDTVFYNGISGTSPGYQKSGFIAKIDSNGYVLWANYFGGENVEEVKDIEIDNNGDVIVLLNTTSNIIYFNDGNTINTSNIDIVLLKYNQIGIRIWGTNIGNTINKKGYSITIDNKDDIYITGFYSGGNNNLMLSKFSVNGNYQWLNTYGSTGINGTSIKYQDDGDIIVVGNFSGNLTLSGNTFYSSTSDMFICKFDTIGNILNVNAFHSNSPNEAFDVDIIGNEYVIVGRHHGDIYFTNDTLYQLGSSSSHSGCIIYLNNDLTHKWSKTIYCSGIGSTTVWNVVANNNNEIFITGGAGADSLIIDTIPLFVVSNDGFLIKLDKDGDYYFANKVGGSTSEFIRSLEENNNNIYIGGSYCCLPFYVQGDTIHHNGTSNNDEMFLIKYQDTTNITITSIESNYYNNVPKKLINVVDILGRKITPISNVLLFYMYNNGTVEKKIIIE